MMAGPVLVLLALLAQLAPQPSLADWNARGKAAIDRRDLKGAEKVYRDALEQARKEGDQAWEAEFLRAIGETYERRNQLKEALPNYEASLSIRQARGDAPETARLLAGIGSVHLKLREDELARQRLEQARAAYVALHDRRNTAFVLQLLGQLCILQGKLDEGQRRLEEASPLFDAVHDDNSAAVVRDDLADLARRRSDFASALRLAFEALEIVRRTNSAQGLARTFESLGQIFTETEQSDKALSYYQQCLEIRLKANNPREVSQAYSNIGLTLGKLGRNREAVETLSKALDLRKATGTPFYVAETLINLANAEQALGNISEAAACFRSALKIAGERNSSQQTAMALYGLGNIALTEGKVDDAISQHAKALKIRQEAGDFIYAVHSMNRLALAYEMKGDLARSEKLHLTALEEFEKIMAGISDPAQIGRFRESTAILYPHYARVLLKEGKTEAAFAVAERSRGAGLARMSELSRRGFLESLTDADRLAWSAAITERARATNRLRDALAAKLAPAALEKAHADYLRADSALAQLRDRLYAANPGLSARAAEVPNTAAILARSRAEPDTLYLEWLMVDKSSTLLFALSGGRVRGFELSCGRDVLAKLSARWRSSFPQGAVRGVVVANRAADAKSEEQTARELYAAVFGPFASELGKKSWKRIAVVPDGPLLDLPFAALADAEGRRLIESYSLTSAVSVGHLFAAGERRPATRSLLAIGDPSESSEARVVAPAGDFYAPLAHARAEVGSIAALFPRSLVVTGGDARESRIKQEIGRYRIIHFATHGILARPDGLQSGLLLASERADSQEDGVLQAWEIADVPLSAELAVLSACQTAEGDERLGEGLMGLAWAFQAAGCSNVVASLWNVDDEATEILMVDFYKAVRGGARVDDALRSAMLAARQSPQRASPFFWAGFRVVGPASALQ